MASFGLFLEANCLYSPNTSILSETTDFFQHVQRKKQMTNYLKGRSKLIRNLASGVVRQLMVVVLRKQRSHYTVGLGYLHLFSQYIF